MRYVWGYFWLQLTLLLRLAMLSLRRDGTRNLVLNVREHATCACKAWPEPSFRLRLAAASRPSRRRGDAGLRGWASQIQGMSSDDPLGTVMIGPSCRFTTLATEDCRQGLMDWVTATKCRTRQSGGPTSWPRGLNRDISPFACPGWAAERVRKRTRTLGLKNKGESTCALCVAAR